ncbi:MAG: peptidase [Bacillales bacterium]|nr:peptidase [Bacillales bacterium]
MRIFKWLVSIFVFYGIGMYLYLFHFADTSIPAHLRWSSVDPSTFMNARQLVLSEDFSNIKNLLFFLSIPFEWIVLFLLLITGISRKFDEWASVISKFRPIHTAVFVFYLSLFMSAISFPLDWISYYISKTYGISVQPFNSWMKDLMIGFWTDYLITFVIVLVMYWLMSRNQQKWWLHAWLLSIPFTLFLSFIQPVIIDPLYNKFTPLENKQLETKILALAKESNIPTDRVYQVNMSEKTKSMNAYVTGIGSNARIVLWDTTLNKLGEKEILFIMAHEMAHYVKKHIYIGLAISLSLSFIGLYIAKVFLGFLTRKWGSRLQIYDSRRLASLPLLLLLFSIMSFAITPFTNAYSRYQETVCDTYAVELTKNSEAGVNTFQELARNSLAQVNPPLLVKIFRYGHPTMLERITTLDVELTKKNKLQEQTND